MTRQRETSPAVAVNARGPVRMRARPGHCRYCDTLTGGDAKLRYWEHCRSCGHKVPVEQPDGRCAPCIRWESGARPITDDRECVASLFAAIVERAVRDRELFGGIVDVPRHCGDHMTRECAVDYLAALLDFGYATEGDSLAILSAVASIAADGLRAA